MRTLCSKLHHLRSTAVCGSIYVRTRHAERGLESASTESPPLGLTMGGVPVDTYLQETNRPIVRRRVREQEGAPFLPYIQRRISQMSLALFFLSLFSFSSASSGGRCDRLVRRRRRRPLGLLPLSPLARLRRLSGWSGGFRSGRACRARTLSRRSGAGGAAAATSRGRCTTDSKSVRQTSNGT